MTTAYLAMDDELLVLRGGNGRWTATVELAGKAPRCVAVDPLEPQRVFVGTSGAGLWTTDDAGASWRLTAEPLAEADMTSLAVSGNERHGRHGVLYVGTEPSALRRSEDGGGTWRELSGLRELPSAPTWTFPPKPYTSHVRWITPDPARAGTLYVCIEAGALVRSFDGGETWVDRTPDGPVDTHTLAAHPRSPGRLYSAAGDGFGMAGRGYNESRDGGDSWDRPDAGLRHQYLVGLAVDPADPDTIVVSAATSPFSAYAAAQGDATVYRRSGEGPWQEVRDGLPEPVGTTRAMLAANPAEPGVFYAATNRGVYRSADAGVRWERLDIEWPPRYEAQGAGALVVSG
jgi:hypothetical protein